jgi:phage shock protein E
LASIANEAEKLKKKGKPVIVCCRSGARSGSAKSILQSKGVEVTNGGTWQNVQAAVR